MYTLIILFYSLGAHIAALFSKKVRLMIKGQHETFGKLRSEIDPDAHYVWVHAASLGEFEQGRPLIERIRATHPHIKILLTFFSPSGYEVRKNYEGADVICYLPFDTPLNARRFVRLANVKMAFFIKYEFWLNYLYELKRRKVRTFVISAIFRRNSTFFKWYGANWRKALDSFEQMFVQNEESKELLHSIGFDNVIVAGDTRFDRVAELAQAVKPVEIVEKFKGESKLFVAGSTWGPDEDILQELINDNPEIKFVVAPHEMDEGRINKIIAATKAGAMRYTRCDATTDFGSTQVLILDTIGILSSVYSYAEWSYIGGGFGVGIHNTLEAAVYGMPVAFGPKYRKFKEACDLIALGAGRSVSSAEELKAWFDELKEDGDYLARLSALAKVYVGQHRGVTERIIEKIKL